ncbi:hypothetical protein F511_34791 [Dorcoceras hygrometricum]|uniref:Uncharacterized protein n=1 Tax=Dorcoceras hygrometricum TaxID=472368 RepID=A0A2Z7AV28_9LAMI|nr:hypothetical protein F511_34791 [Dorcoceras hygrometricum]
MVQIHGLPSDCWTNVFLSKLASVIGKPLYMDRVTYMRTNENFARVLVELNITTERRREVGVQLPTGITIQASFVYEGEPKFCEICQMMGHATMHCKREEIRKGKMKVDDMDQPTNEEPVPVDIPQAPPRDKTPNAEKKSRSRSRNRKRSVSRNRANTRNTKVDEKCSMEVNNPLDDVDNQSAGLDNKQDSEAVDSVGKKETHNAKDNRVQGNITGKSASLNEANTVNEDDFQIIGKRGKVVKKKNVQQNLVVESNSPTNTTKTVAKITEDCDKMAGQSSCNQNRVVLEEMTNNKSITNTKIGVMDGTASKEKTQQVGKQGKTPKKKNSAKIPIKKNEAESSSCDTDFVAVDPKTGLPILDGKTYTKKQIEFGRRISSASNQL